MNRRSFLHRVLAALGLAVFIKPNATPEPISPILAMANKLKKEHNGIYNWWEREPSVGSFYQSPPNVENYIRYFPEELVSNVRITDSTNGYHEEARRWMVKCLAETTSPI